MARILILYHSTDGHTVRICERIRHHIRSIDEHAELELRELAGFEPGRAADPDKVVIGASIRYGHHHASVAQFIERHRDWLAARPGAFFSVNVVARKPGKDLPQTNPYLVRFLEQISWRPDLVDVFAGRIRYAMYRWTDRVMIRLIMWLTHGPTDPATDAVFTDWQRVERFAERVAGLERVGAWPP